MSSTERQGLRRGALRVALVYAAFAGLWILLSDRAMGLIWQDPQTLVRASMLKGWFFVAVTTLLLYVLVRQLVGQLDAAHRREQAQAKEKARAQQLLATIARSSSDANLAKDAQGQFQGTFGISRDITERTAAEQRLAESEARYRSLFENMNTGFVLFEVVRGGQSRPVDLLVLAANQEFADVTGLDTVAATGQRLTTLLPGIKADRADWIGRYGQVPSTGEPCQFEQASEHLGMHFSVSAFRAGEGLCAVTFLDITRRRQTEAALRESEERLRLALAAASQGLYDLNLQTGEATVSPEYAAMLGYEPAGFRETIDTWRERLHPDDRARVLSTLDDYLAGRVSTYRIEFRQRTRDGRWKWVLSLGQIEQRTEDGRPLRMLGTHTDIDALKSAEARAARPMPPWRPAWPSAPPNSAPPTGSWRPLPTRSPTICVRHCGPSAAIRTPSRRTSAGSCPTAPRLTSAASSRPATGWAS